MESIAQKLGLFWQTLWDDLNNAELKNKRKDPNVLLPGDVVFIPTKRLKEKSGQTEQRHRFRLKGVPSKLKIQLLDEEDEARGNVEYVIDIDGQLYRGLTNADGWIRRPIAPDAKRAKLTVIEDGEEEEYQLNLGHLDPIDQDSGVQQRLSNLGFDCGAEEGQVGPQTQAALKDFQKKHGLEETGTADEATRTELQKVYGS